jgi:hypothetical protein
MVGGSRIIKIEQTNLAVDGELRAAHLSKYLVVCVVHGAEEPLKRLRQQCMSMLRRRTRQAHAQGVLQTHRKQRPWRSGKLADSLHGYTLAGQACETNCRTVMPVCQSVCVGLCVWPG